MSFATISSAPQKNSQLYSSSDANQQTISSTDLVHWPLSSLSLSFRVEDEDLGPAATVSSLSGHQQSTYQIKKHLQVWGRTHPHTHARTRTHNLLSLQRAAVVLTSLLAVGAQRSSDFSLWNHHAGCPVSAEDGYASSEWLGDVCSPQTKTDCKLKPFQSGFAELRARPPRLIHGLRGALNAYFSPSYQAVHHPRIAQTPSSSFKRLGSEPLQAPQEGSLFTRAFVSYAFEMLHLREGLSSTF